MGPGDGGIEQGRGPEERGRAEEERKGEEEAAQRRTGSARPGRYMHVLVEALHVHVSGATVMHLG